MMGGFLSRLFLLAFGYAYPAYECYKTVELNKPEIEQLLFWCQYWILVAFLTVLERFGDALISWLPLYNEAKLAFFIYLWYPKTKGTTYIYEGFFKPYLAKHEGEIDRNLLELRVRAVDIFALYWQKAATVSQSTFFDVLQYVANQSSRPRRAAAPKPPQATVPQQQQQPQQKKPTQIRRTLSNRQEASTSANPPPEISTIPRLRRVGSGRSGAVPVASTATDSNESTPKSAGTEPGTGFTNPEPSAPPAIIEEEEEVVEVAEEEMTVDVQEIEGEEMLAETDETPMDEAIRVTRARLRKRVATSAVAPPTPA